MRTENYLLAFSNMEIIADVDRTTAAAGGESNPACSNFRQGMAELKELYDHQGMLCHTLTASPLWHRMKTSLPRVPWGQEWPGDQALSHVSHLQVPPYLGSSPMLPPLLVAGGSCRRQKPGSQ